ncbi:hypothetical protein KFE25_010588 [Diacronema lutheri]|uniref:DAGKc domain-containing protein n=2 Tax=Diacronema lutheri TaxID=2081491 RepID=A0A8J5X9L5_DIALT|nr:hypothetical protein KFE25_010588 [Diacronema lutheri]
MLPHALAALAASYLVRAALRWRAHANALRDLHGLTLVRRAAASVVLIANPIAGLGEAVVVARAICALAHRMGCRAEVRETRHVGHARQLAAEAASDGFTHVLSVGGDGQLHEVINGLHDARALDGVRVGAVPEGTGNGVCTSLGLNTATDAARAFAADDVVLLDLWAVRADPPTARPFACALSIGWGAVADIDALAEREWRWIGPMRTTLIAAGIAARHRSVCGAVWFTPARAQPDGDMQRAASHAELVRALADGRVRVAEGGPSGCTHVLLDHFFLVHACNVASIARDCHLAPDARPADGSLTLCVVRRRCGRLASAHVLLSLRAAARGAPTPTAAGGAGGDEHLERYLCSQLAIVPASPAARFAVDGELIVADRLHASHALGVRGRPQLVRVLASPRARAGADALPTAHGNLRSER